MSRPHTLAPTVRPKNALMLLLGEGKAVRQTASPMGSCAALCDYGNT